jgi:hypothetical protein
MSGFQRRVIVDGPFNRTLWSVIETLARDGFSINTTEGTPPRADVGRGCRKHVQLEATYPHLTAEVLKAGLSQSVLLPCRIAVYELSTQKTAVVVADTLAPATCFSRWQGEHPVLAAVAWDADERITRALEALAHHHVPCMAVA